MLVRMPDIFCQKYCSRGQRRSFLSVNKGYYIANGNYKEDKSVGNAMILLFVNGLEQNLSGSNAVNTSPSTFTWIRVCVRMNRIPGDE